MAKVLFDQILNDFLEKKPWLRFDEWNAFSIELGQSQGYPEACAFFGDDPEGGYRLMILRGSDCIQKYMKYRDGDWTPEFGLDFATTDGFRVHISDDGELEFFSHRPGSPPEELRVDEKTFVFDVLSAINLLWDWLDQEKVPILEESDLEMYALWKVGDHWKAEVRPIPEEKFSTPPGLNYSSDRLDRMKKVSLPREGVWEVAPFFLPVTRIQGNQEVFVQCAGVAERGEGLIGLVTLEAHADPIQELLEGVLGSIEKQARLPEWILVKEEQVYERLFPVLSQLGVSMRLRKKLPELEICRFLMIEEFPEDEDVES